MSTPGPGAPPPDDERPSYGSDPRQNPGWERPERSARNSDDEVADLAYGRLYGRAPGTGGGGLRTTYTFVLVWVTTALIMFYGSRLLGFERGDTGAAVVSLVVSLVAAIAITVWARNRR